MTKSTLNCAKCKSSACQSEKGSEDIPACCPMLANVDTFEYSVDKFTNDPAVRELALAAARTESGGYCRDTRIEETVHFARRIGAGHLGIACCIGLRREAAVVQQILEAAGFKVSSVVCKAGAIPKENVGIADDEKIRPGQFEPVCNPIAQAKLLEQAGTQLNIVVGLCVGHDSLFFMHSAAPVTVLIAKDRVTGHNPIAPIYTAGSYYKKLKAKN